MDNDRREEIESGHAEVLTFGGAITDFTRSAETDGSLVVVICPRVWTGDPISLDTGYSTKVLQRITGLAVDPTGNVWAVNNRTPSAPQIDPGGNSIVVFPGIAAPVKTTLIGPVESAVENRRWGAAGCTSTRLNAPAQPGAERYCCRSKMTQDAVICACPAELW